MKFINTADWHFAPYSYDTIIKQSGLPDRLNSLVTTLNNMFNYGRENKIKNIVVNGDILHNKSVIYSFSLSILLDLIKNNSDINFILLDGNHDMSSKTKDGVSGLKALDSISNVHTIHEIEKVENILFIPWKYASKELFKKEKSDYAISHFGLSEAQLNSGISIVSDISMKDLSNFKFVLLGHYHKAQYLKNKDTELFYTGNPTQLDWGEKGEIKRFLVVDTELHTTLSIPTVGYKKYFELDITKDNKNEIIEQAKQLKLDGHEVKLIKKEIFDTDDVSDDYRLIDKIDKDITNRGITSSMTDDQKLLKYLEIKNIPSDKIERYKNIGLEIINSVGTKK
jgi:DNA repair exonuclease SbcCD nuclease subunit